MNNKYMKYGLICSVVVVWGAIIYRVAATVSDPDHPPRTVLTQPKTEVPAAPDSFVLFADYPDPFLPEPDSIELLDPHKPATAQGAPGNIPNGGINNPLRPEPPAPPTVQSYLLYIGMIANPGKKLKIAIISLHGKELLLKEKERHEDLLVKKIDKEKIGVVYKRRYYDIFKNN